MRDSLHPEDKVQKHRYPQQRPSCGSGRIKTHSQLCVLRRQCRRRYWTICETSAGGRNKRHHQYQHDEGYATSGHEGRRGADTPPKAMTDDAL